MLVLNTFPDVLKNSTRIGWFLTRHCLSSSEMLKLLSKYENRNDQHHIEPSPEMLEDCIRIDSHADGPSYAMISVSTWIKWSKTHSIMTEWRDSTLIIPLMLYKRFN